MFCAGAVKFGDALSMRECELIVENLQDCRLPFQCAHGRPSIMPLLDLKQLAALSQPHKVPTTYVALPTTSGFTASTVGTYYM